MQKDNDTSIYAAFEPVELVHEPVQKQCSAVQSSTVQTIKQIEIVDNTKAVSAVQSSTVQTIKQIEIVDNTKAVSAVVELGIALCGLAVTVIQSLSESIAGHVERKRRMRYLGKISEADRARTRQYLHDCAQSRSERTAKFNIQINGGENNITINS